MSIDVLLYNGLLGSCRWWVRVGGDSDSVGGGVADGGGAGVGGCR